MATGDLLTTFARDYPMNRSIKLRIQIEEIIRKCKGIDRIDGIEGRNGARLPIISSTNSTIHQ